MSALERLRAAYRTHRLVRWASDGLLLLALLVAASAWQTRRHPTGLAPDFTLPRVDGGGTVSRAGLAGRPALLVFWAPWCGVCKAMAPNVERLRGWVGERAQVVSIAAAYQSPTEVQREVLAQHLGSPVLLGDEALTQAFHVEAFPTLYVLDEAGRVRHSAVGYTTTLGLWARLFVP